MISDNLCEQLSQVSTTLTFYMNSYLVYIVASGLSTNGDRSLIPVWEYYDQLTFRFNRVHYRRAQDAFFGHFMCLFDKTLKSKGVSEAAWRK